MSDTSHESTPNLSATTREISAAPASVKQVIPDLEMRFICKEIHNRRCVPFLGAAVNVSSTSHSYSGLRLGSAVAEEFAKETGSTGNLARLTLEVEVRTGRRNLLEMLAQFLPEHQCEPSPALRTLAKLRCLKLIVTTNYDRLLERALTAANRMQGNDYELLIQPSEGFDETADTRAQLDRLWVYEGLTVYKLHGTFLDIPTMMSRNSSETATETEALAPLIITEDDYIEFLTVVRNEVGERIGVPRMITTPVKTSTLLFLGYSLEDWDFRMIHRGLIEPMHRKEGLKSYAIQRNPPEFWKRFWEKKNVTIFDVDLYDFTSQLEVTYAELYGLDDAPPQRNTRRL
jgi:SIR2-like domain